MARRSGSPSPSVPSFNLFYWDTALPGHYLLIASLLQLTDETPDLVPKRLCVTDPPPVVLARQLDIARLRDMTGKISSSLDRNAPVTTAMENQCGNTEARQLGSHVSIADSLKDGLHRAWACGQALRLRPPLAKSFIMR